MCRCSLRVCFSAFHRPCRNYRALKAAPREFTAPTRACARVPRPRARAFESALSARPFFCASPRHTRTGLRRYRHQSALHQKRTFHTMSKSGGAAAAAAANDDRQRMTGEKNPLKGSTFPGGPAPLRGGSDWRTSARTATKHCNRKKADWYSGLPPCRCRRCAGGVARCASRAVNARRGDTPGCSAPTPHCGAAERRAARQANAPPSSHAFHKCGDARSVTGFRHEYDAQYSAYDLNICLGPRFIITPAIRVAAVPENCVTPGAYFPAHRTASRTYNAPRRTTS